MAFCRDFGSALLVISTTGVVTRTATWLHQVILSIHHASLTTEVPVTFRHSMFYDTSSHHTGSFDISTIGVIQSAPIYLHQYKMSNPQSMDSLFREQLKYPYVISNRYSITHRLIPWATFCSKQLEYIHVLISTEISALCRKHCQRTALFPQPLNYGKFSTP